MMEIWKDMIGYKGLYQVSNLGRVKSLHRFVNRPNDMGYYVNDRILIPQKHSTGYPHIRLRKNNKGISLFIHRLVGKAFIPNPGLSSSLCNKKYFIEK